MERLISKNIIYKRIDTQKKGKRLLSFFIWAELATILLQTFSGGHRAYARV